MKTFRVPIAALMALVLLCGLAFAALRSLSMPGANAAVVGMWTMVFAAVIGSRYGRYRAFSDGFWIVGGGYAVLAFAPGSATEVRPYLATSVLLEEVAVRLELPKRVGWYRFGTLSGKVTTSRSSAFPGLSGLDEGDRYERIGHSVAAIVHGIAGGTLAGALAARRRTEEAT